MKIFNPFRRVVLYVPILERCSSFTTVWSSDAGWRICPITDPCKAPAMPHTNSPSPLTSVDLIVCFSLLSPPLPPLTRCSNRSAHSDSTEPGCSLEYSSLPSPTADIKLFYTLGTFWDPRGDTPFVGGRHEQYICYLTKHIACSEAIPLAVWGMTAKLQCTFFFSQFYR